MIPYGRPLTEELKPEENKEDGIGAADDSVKTTLRSAKSVKDMITTQLKHTISLQLALRASINIAEDVSNCHAERKRG